MTLHVDEVHAKATRRDWIGLGVIALACMLYSMDLTVLNLAVPALSRDLQPSSSQLLWIIDIYGFMVAGMLVTMGNLGDRIGRRRLLMIGAAFFGVASVFAAFATSAEMLIAMRALHGIAGATIAPSTLSLIRNMFHDPAQRTAAIGWWISAFSAGAAIGPVVGGVLLEWFWWGSVFLINVPVMVVLLLAAPRLLPEFRDPGARALDLPSALLSIAAVLAVIYGLKRIAEHGPSAAALLAMVAGVAIGALFVRRQRRLDDPLIDLRLFAVPAFGASLGLYLLAGCAMFGIYIYIAQYLQLVLGLSPLMAGLATVPWAVPFIIGSTLTPRLVQRFGTMPLISGGLLIGAASFGLIALIDTRTSVSLILVAMVTMSIGLAPVFTLATDLVVGSAPPERAGSAAAMSETCAEFGGALGIALFGSLGTALYRAAMADFDLSGLGAETVESARATLGGAEAVARQLPGASGELLLSAARDAFMQGMQITAVVGALMILGMGITATIVTRRARPRAAAGCT